MLRIQITGLQGADKATVKKVKKETKGSNGLPFKCNPYYVRDTDKVTPKFKKSGELKSVKVFINGKEYKAKKDEYSYDKSRSCLRAITLTEAIAPNEVSWRSLLSSRLR